MLHHSAFARVVILAAMVFASAGYLSARDLLVQRGNPTAYQDLQSAVNAAQPGDRILIRGSLPSSQGVRINKSLSIVGESGYSPTLFFEWPAGMTVASLTPGIPLVIENLSVRCGMLGGLQGFLNAQRVVGDIVINRVNVECGAGTSYIAGFPIFVQSTRLVMRGCQVITHDTPDNDAFCGELYASGVDAVQFTGDELIIEDCYLRGSSGNVLRFYTGPMCPDGGSGGRAVYSRSRATSIVRSTLIDGNGGSVEPNAGWPRPPVPGRAVPSQLTASNGIVGAYMSFHQLGLDDHGGQGRPRGPVLPLGSPAAPLSISDASIGRQLSVTISPSGSAFPIAILMATALSSGATPWGILHLRPDAIFAGLPFVGYGTISVPLPDDEALIGRELGTQVVVAYWSNPGVPELGNPSASWIGR